MPIIIWMGDNFATKIGFDSRYIPVRSTLIMYRNEARACFGSMDSAASSGRTATQVEILLGTFRSQLYELVLVQVPVTVPVCGMPICNLLDSTHQSRSFFFVHSRIHVITKYKTHHLSTIYNKT